MLIWGSRAENKDLGVVENKQCSTCEKERPFHLAISYKWSHFYWVFGQVSKRQYFLLCDVCRRGWELDAKKVEADLPRNPIPFMRRYGWVVPGTLFLALVLVFLFGSR